MYSPFKWHPMQLFRFCIAVVSHNVYYLDNNYTTNEAGVAVWQYDKNISARMSEKIWTEITFVDEIDEQNVDQNKPANGKTDCGRHATKFTAQFTARKCCFAEVKTKLQPTKEYNF